MSKRALAAGAVLAVLAAGGCKRDAAPAGDVWAVVNGQQIHRAEAEKYYSNRLNDQSQAQLANQGQTPQSQEEAMTLMLNIVDELINNQILVQRAQKLNLQATDGEVEDKFTEFKSPYTEEEFQKQLKERGLGVDDLKQDIREQLSVQKLLNKEVSAKVSITDQDVSDFYKQYKTQFNVPETQYRIAKIVITPHKDQLVRNRKNDDATTDTEARRKADALVQQLNSGTDFSQLAMDYSEDPATALSGGDLGYIPESALNQNSPPALKTAVARMRPGEISPVIALPDGYYILKLIAKEAPGQRDINDPQVQQSIRDTIRNRKEQLLRSAYLAEARDQSQVTNYLAQQVMESLGKLPEMKITPPPEAQQPPAPTPASAPPSAPAPAQPH
jgi:peptidyl-prolyl cis-trans isomerase SurA